MLWLQTAVLSQQWPPLYLSELLKVILNLSDWAKAKPGTLSEADEILTNFPLTPVITRPNNEWCWKLYLLVWLFKRIDKEGRLAGCY